MMTTRPTNEQIAVAVKEMRERAKVHRCSAATWKSIRSHYNRDLDSAKADALSAVAAYLEGEAK